MNTSEKKLKLAILMAGRIMNYKNAYPNIMENIVQGNDVDFFLSHSPELDEDLEDFRKVFQPNILNNDPHDIKMINPHFQHQNRHNLIKMIYNNVKNQITHPFKTSVTFANKIFL